MNFVIRKAIPSDYSLLSEIGRQTFYETWRPVNTEEDMQAYMKESFDPGKLEKDIQNVSVNTFLLASAGEIPIGYVKLRRDREYDDFGKLPAIEIERIYVKQEWQGMKAGKALMDKCIELATAENFHWIWLGVNIDNHKAIHFYKQYGFEIFGTKSFQLGNARDDDYLMKRKVIPIT